MNTRKAIEQLTIRIIPVLLAASIMASGGDPSAIDAKKTKFVAHRGLSREYYENTADAFTAAGQSDFFYGIETDVRQTLDGYFVCSHDKTPFTDKTKIIENITLEEALQLPLKGSGSSQQNQIATFEEYLDICSNYDKNAFIDLKITNISQETASKLIEILKEKNMLGRCTFISASKKDIETIKEIHPQANCQILYDLISVSEKKIKPIDYSENISITRLRVSKSVVSKAHKAGKEVAAWTVNDIRFINKLAEMGVDYITTDVDFSDKLFQKQPENPLEK